MSAILRLTKGDKVRNADGRTGAVCGFGRNFVSIEWDGDRFTTPYSDSDLLRLGIVKTSPADALRPVKSGRAGSTR